MDCFKYFFHKLCIHAALFTLCTALFKNLIITSGLENGDSVFFLVSTDLTCYAHSLSQFLDDVIVAFGTLSFQGDLIKIVEKGTVRSDTHGK